MITYRIPLAGLKFSTNKIYAGVHWSKRKEIADGIHGIAELFCRPVQVVRSYPVSVRYRFFFVTRPLDTTNCTFMVKCIEDALRAIGIIAEDTPEYVGETIIQSIAAKRPEGKKGSDGSGAKADAPDEDTVEITINEFNYGNERKNGLEEVCIGK